MAETLTIQMKLGHEWRDAAELMFNPDRSRAQLTYEVDAVCEAQAHLACPEAVWEGVRSFSSGLLDLDARLEALGLPEETLSFPAIGLRQVNARLRSWDLIGEGERWS